MQQRGNHRFNCECWLDAWPRHCRSWSDVGFCSRTHGLHSPGNALSSAVRSISAVLDVQARHCGTHCGTHVHRTACLQSTAVAFVPTVTCKTMISIVAPDAGHITEHNTLPTLFMKTTQFTFNGEFPSSEKGQLPAFIMKSYLNRPALNSCSSPSSPTDP